MAMTETQWMQTFAIHLKRLMVQNNMTQRELAKATGISEGTISRYLNRQAMPSVNALVNIADVFNCTDINDLLYFGDAMEMRPSRRW